MMKANKMLDELMETAKNIGFTIRRDAGGFRSGSCIIHDKKMIIINRSASPENMSIILATAISPYIEDTYVKPLIREYIEKELVLKSSEKDFELEIKNEERDK